MDQETTRNALRAHTLTLAGLLLAGSAVLLQTINGKPAKALWQSVDAMKP